MPRVRERREERATRPPINMEPDKGLLADRSIWIDLDASFCSMMIGHDLCLRMSCPRKATLDHPGFMSFCHVWPCAVPACALTCKELLHPSFSILFGSLQVRVWLQTCFADVEWSHAVYCIPVQGLPKPITQFSEEKQASCGVCSVGYWVPGNPTFGREGRLSQGWFIPPKGDPPGLSLSPPDSNCCGKARPSGIVHSHARFVGNASLSSNGRRNGLTNDGIHKRRGTASLSSDPLAMFATTGLE